VDISLRNPSPLRLLVTDPDIDRRWSPPPLTRANGDAPMRVTCNGGTYWAIPPNVPHDAKNASGGMATGFATFWDGESLAPNGGYYYKPLTYDSKQRPVQEGDLVFQ